MISSYKFFYYKCTPFLAGNQSRYYADANHMLLTINLFLVHAQNRCCEQHSVCLRILELFKYQTY